MMEHSKRVSTWILLGCMLWVPWLRLAWSLGSDERRLVCYYANWAIYRPGQAKFTPENINPNLCTHLIYAFAGMNKHYELKPFDSYNDLQLGNYKKFTNLKTYNPKLKVMIAVGGWNEGSKRFSKMVEEPSSRARFVKGALSFLRKHGFDGLDLDWEYPGSRDGGRDSDKEGYTKLVQELREAFDSESVPSGRSRLLLTMAVPAGKQYIDKGYDVPVISKHLDFLNLLTYDYHTGHEAEVRHHAPLREQPGLEDWSPTKQFNVEWTVHYYVSLGCDPRKLVLGIPTYGRSFTLEDPDETDIGSPAVGPGEKGEATREAGYLAYYEICQMIQDQEWELEAPYPEKMGPYAYKDNQWVGFDDEDIIIEKVKFIVRENLGGGMVWTLDNDDFRGKCYGEQSPLISTLKSALEEGKALLDKATTTPSSTTKSPSRRPKTTAKAAPPSPPPVFTTPDPGPPFECEDEGFYNHPGDCKKYFWCLDSGPSDLGLVAHAFTCPSGLYFNKKRDSCDYANNVVCRVKKTTTVSTTPRPRPRPRPKKTTTTTTRTTTTTTTTTPRPKLPKDLQKDLKDLKGPLDAMNKESLSELLNLLQQLGVNQIHDKLHGRESQEANTTSVLLPEYRIPNRQRLTPEITTAPSTDLFFQYAQPERTANKNGETSASSPQTRTGAKPRGPQYHAPPEAPEADHGDLFPEGDDEEPSDKEEGFNFPFVYQTPSRQRSKQTTPKEDDVEDEEEEEGEDEDDVVVPTTTTARSKPTQPHRRRVVKVRPVPGEGRNTGTRGNRYSPAQTVGVRQEVRPNALEKSTTLHTRYTTPRTRQKPSTTTTPPPAPRYRRPAVPRELIVLATGKPAVPATTRRYREPSIIDMKGPALALLPDGSITCLRRGVYPHPKDCTKFLVCVPATEGRDLDGFIHDCPKETIFLENKGRCMPGDKQACSIKEE